MGPSASFYFDLASPEAYLAAERILQVLPGAAAWQPVLARELGPAPAHLERPALERRVRELELQPLRMPARFPFDSALAMRVATYAQSIGRVVAFAQAAFRQAYAGGHDLCQPDRVLIAAAACEMHPAAVLAAERLRSTGERLRERTQAARAAGVRSVPAVLVDGRVFHGEGALEQAALHMRDAAIGAGAR